MVSYMDIEIEQWTSDTFLKFDLIGFSKIYFSRKLGICISFIKISHKWCFSEKQKSIELTIFEIICFKQKNLEASKGT